MKRVARFLGKIDEINALQCGDFGAVALVTGAQFLLVLELIDRSNPTAKAYREHALHANNAHGRREQINIHSSDQSFPRTRNHLARSASSSISKISIHRFPIINLAREEGLKTAGLPNGSPL
jgi:hypothetical protein